MTTKIYYQVRCIREWQGGMGEKFEVGKLYKMRDSIADALIKAGYVVREGEPVKEVVVVSGEQVSLF